jgi:LAO/AO transport system kinase
MEAVDTVVVVLVPEAGDAIQAMKAGLLEIADIFAVNKTDRPGADQMVVELEIMLHQNPKQSWWQVPVIATQAINDIGIEKLYQQIESHRQAIKQSGRYVSRRREQMRREFIATIEQRLTAQLWGLVEKNGRLANYLERVGKGELDPYSASMEILSDKTLLQTWLQELGRGSSSEE